MEILREHGNYSGRVEGKRKRNRVSKKGKGLGGDERNRLRGAKV